MQVEKYNLKDNTKIYILAWLSLIVSLFAYKKIMIVGANEEKTLNIFFVYMFISWIPLMVINYFESRRLTKYLEESSSDKYEYLSSAFGKRVGGNGFKMIAFLLSNDHLDDSNVKRLKNIYKRFILFVLVVFFSYPVLLVSVMFTN
jgi:hypothetical protein